MIKPTSRILKTEKGIEFYEQDVLFDDYIYTGNFDIDVSLEYNNLGFGIMIINSEGKELYEKEEYILFKLGNKNLEVIYKNKEKQRVLFNYSCTAVKTCSDINLKIMKRENDFNIYINKRKIATYKSKIDTESFNLGYYSNKDNVLKNVNIAAAIPYSWIVNMENTNGGYIEFQRDGFEIKDCTGEAEVGQVEINLRRGTYFLKYKKSEGSDIKAYVFEYDDPLIIDEEKNLLQKDESFFIESYKGVTIKFVGTKGKISRISITTLKENEYVRTSPDVGDYIKEEGSYVNFVLEELKEFSFKGTVLHVPGLDHTSPMSYQIVSDGYKNYGLYDTNMAINVEYEFKYKNKELTILKNNRQISKIIPKGDILSVFKNVNAIINNLIVTDKNGNTDVVVVENTIRKSVPGTIKSPIVVLDKHENPLDLSASFRYYYKNNEKYYLFTNKEREYFNPSHVLKLNAIPSSKSGSIIAYGIKKDTRFNLDRLLEIEKPGKDTIDSCADLYDIFFEEDLKYIDKGNKEIRFSEISDYQMIIVDYLKEDSYSINYKYEMNSYEIDISTTDNKEVNILYDNTEKEIDDIEYINEKIYLDTKMIPSRNCYVVLGR